MTLSRLLCLLTLPLGGCLATGLFQELLGPTVPNPYQGEQELSFALSCDQAEAAGPILSQRLELLDLDHERTVTGPGRIRLTIHDAAQPQALTRLLTASPDLGFHAVLDDQRPLRPGHEPPEEAALDAVVGPGHRPDLAFDVDAVQAMFALAGGALPPVEGVRLSDAYGPDEIYVAPPGADWQPWLATLNIPEGAGVVLECHGEGEDELCGPLLVEQPAALGAAQVDEVSMEWDEQGMVIQLELRFDETGREAFHALTQRIVRRWLAIVSDGRVLSRPMVAEPIPGGRAWLNVGMGSSERDLLELWRFYALLDSGPLPGACQLADG